METCFICDDPVDRETDFCCGCEQYVCEACDGVLPLDPHSPEIHEESARQRGRGR